MDGQVASVTAEALEAALPELRRAPREGGTVEMVVARPAEDERVTLSQATFTIEDGLVGDGWRARGSARAPDGRAEPDRQVTLMNARYLELIAGARERWPLAGDQLIVDLDLSEEHLGAGDRLRAGSVTFEVTDTPHNGCRKFADRYGRDAVVFANSPVGKQLHLRGIYARVVVAGTLRVGDVIEKLPA